MHDLHVLARLRHDALVGRDHHGDDVDAGRARDHVLDELLVPRHVDDADVLAVREVEVREAEVDRHPALLLLVQAVGVDAGERLDQRRLAVVDVPGGAQYDLFHGVRVSESVRCKVLSVKLKLGYFFRLHR